MMADIVGTTTPRRPPATNAVRLYVHQGIGGDDGNPGTDPANPLATFVEARNRVRAHPWNTRFIIDITGADEQPGHDLGLDLPLAGDEFRYNIFDPGAPPHRTIIAEATFTVIARPTLVHTFSSPTVMVEPVHSMVRITESPDPGWAPNEHRRRMVAGQGFFECGAIVANTSDTLVIAYAGALTPPIEILAPGARLRFGTAVEGIEFRPGLILNTRCRSIWQWIDFMIPDGNAGTSLMIHGGTAMVDLINCAITGIDMRRGAEVNLDGCYIDRGWAFNDVSFGTNMRRCAVVGALSSSHAGNYFMLNNRFDGCGPLGTGGTAHYSGSTIIEDCEHLNGTGNGHEAQGQGRHTLRRTLIGGAAGNGVDVIGPVRAVLDDVQGSGNVGHGLRALHGAHVEVRNGTAVVGLDGEISAGSLGTKAWADVPFSDLSGVDPHLVRVHTTTIIPSDGGGGDGGAWQLMETQSISVDTTTITFDVDGDADGEYLIRGQWNYQPTASSARLIVKPNGITANQRTGWGTGGASTTNGNLARLVIAPQPGSGINSAKFEAKFEAKSGGLDRQLTFSGGSGDSAGGLLSVNFRSYHGYGMWADTATIVTQLVLEVVGAGAATIADGISAGSEFSLYRVQK